MPRTIRARTKGVPHGFLRRVVSPGDLGAILKPFVFLDHVEGAVAPGTGFGWHPHSGIATLTYALDADVAYEDTTGQAGTVEATGLEWMRAGGGTWHRGVLHPRAPNVTAFQLWVALPPGVEDGPSEGLYVPPEEVPQVGEVRVLLGSHGGRRNPIPTPSPITWLDVVLREGQAWELVPERGQTVAWAFVYRGRAKVEGEPVEGELVVLEEGEGPIVLEASSAARVLVGTAAKHDLPLVLGSYSVHTSREALARGEARIAAVRDELRRAGRL